MKLTTLYSEYQPLISSKDNQIFAYEALMRSQPKISPLSLIKHARNQGVLYDLDMECIKNAIVEYPLSFFCKYYLFINIFPSTIVHSDFRRFIIGILRKYSYIRGRIVFEINEDILDDHIWTRIEFLRGLQELKSYGFQIAFDDMPIVHSSFLKISSLTPDFVKLDHTNANKLSQSLDKQKLISLFLEYTNEKIGLVLEGIETEQDLLTAKELGVPFLQGYYISRPKCLNLLRKIETL